MATTYDIKILFTVFKDVVLFLVGQTETKKNNTIEAHKTIHSAFIKTYDYIRNKNGQYSPNPELAEVWNIASAAIMKVDIQLGTMLHNKSRFWIDPQFYINLKGRNEIIELMEIVEEMEKLRMKL